MKNNQQEPIAMDDRFFSQPVLYSPYEHPAKHWELDVEDQPTEQIIERRRGAEFITPIPMGLAVRIIYWC